MLAIGIRKEKGHMFSQARFGLVFTLAGQSGCWQRSRKEEEESAKDKKVKGTVRNVPTAHSFPFPLQGWP